MYTSLETILIILFPLLLFFLSISQDIEIVYPFFHQWFIFPNVALAPYISEILSIWPIHKIIFDPPWLNPFALILLNFFIALTIWHLMDIFVIFVCWLVIPSTRRWAWWGQGLICFVCCWVPCAHSTWHTVGAK